MTDTPRLSVPRLSVVVPAYNNGRTLRETLRSVLDQDVDGLELIVGDHSSADDTAQVMAEFASDPRVTLHVASKDFWTWVAVEGTAELTPVAQGPHDAAVEELIAYYRGVSGEHENWDDYRAAMVADRRLVVRFRPEHAYGQLPG